MIITIALFLSAIGFAAFVVGNVLDWTGVATIGAVLILGVGAAITTQGLSYASGERVEQISNNTTEKVTTYQQADFPQRLSVGFLVMLLGGMLVIRQLEDTAT